MAQLTVDKGVALLNPNAPANAVLVDAAGNMPITAGASARATYRAGIQVTAVTAATDVFQLLGSATKTIRVWRIGINGISTAAATQTINFILRSAADTGGTQTPVVGVPLDSVDPAATATAATFAALPALGSVIGTIYTTQLETSTSTSVGGDSIEELFGNLGGKPIVLRGAANALCVNCGGAIAAGLVLTIFIEWTEE